MQLDGHTYARMLCLTGGPPKGGLWLGLKGAGLPVTFDLCQAKLR